MAGIVMSESKTEWSMSQEREFMENLLNQRFNFFMLVFALVIGGAVQVQAQLHFQLLLSVGAFLLLMLLPTLYRAQAKLDIIFKCLRKSSREPVNVHVAIEVDRMLKAQSCGLNWSVRRYIGFYIPTICMLLLLAAAVAAWGNWLTVAPATP